MADREQRRGGAPGQLSVRPLVAADLAAAVELHLSGLSEQFLTRLGGRFLRAYHEAYRDSPAGIQLAALDRGSGRLLGFLLGTLDPARHYPYLLRRHGPRLVGLALLAGIRRPALGVALIRTRARRYLLGLARLCAAWAGRTARTAPAARFAPQRTQPPDAPQSTYPSGALTGEPPPIGEITLVVVCPDARGRGVGRALVEEACRQARERGLAALELVTPVGETVASAFYRRLGWQPAGSLRSRSGEDFLRYRFALQPEPTARAQDSSGVASELDPGRGPTDTPRA